MFAVYAVSYREAFSRESVSESKLLAKRVFLTAVAANKVFPSHCLRVALSHVTTTVNAFITTVFSRLAAVSLSVCLSVYLARVHS